MALTRDSRNLALTASLILCVMFFKASPAQASLIGDTVTCAVTGQITSCSQASALVGAGIEFTFGNALPGGTQFFSVDYRTNDVVFTVLASYAFSVGSTIFSSSDTTHAFTSESLISVSGFFGTLGASNISLSGGTLMVALNGTGGNQGDTFDIGLSTTPVTTPEPGTAGLISMATLFFVWMGKWRQHRSPLF